MPRFREMEKGHGSLIRAVMRQAKKQPKANRNSSGGRYSMFVAPRKASPAWCKPLPIGSLRNDPAGAPM